MMLHRKHPASRLRIAEGILKALFTTSPIKATDVIVKKDGQVVVKPVDTPDGAHLPA